MTVSRILNVELRVGDLTKETANQTVLKMPSGFFSRLIGKCERQYISERKNYETKRSQHWLVLKILSLSRWQTMLKLRNSS